MVLIEDGLWIKRYGLGLEEFWICSLGLKGLSGDLNEDFCFDL